MVKVGETISSPICDYLVKDIVGHGGFGTVAVCKKKNANNLVALKIIQGAKALENSKDETNILEKMRRLGCQNFNIVMWEGSFMAANHFCIEFERLEMSISEYMKKNSFSLKEIRPFLQQMSVALQFLGTIGLVHADLKPHNIMLVDHHREPLKFKLIDFGLAHNVPEGSTGLVRGTLMYIAPEMLLGAPYTNAVDTWALGCIAVEMMTRRILFPGRNPAEILRLVISLLGNIPINVINSGHNRHNYFYIAYIPHLLTYAWLLKMPIMPAGVPAFPPYSMGSLNELLTVPQLTTVEDFQAELFDRMIFVELVANMLNLDPEQRIKPSDILRHSFLTLSHLHSNDCSYKQESINLMRVCQRVPVDMKKHVPLFSAASKSSKKSSKECPVLQSKSSGKKRARHEEDNDPYAFRHSQQNDDDVFGVTSHRVVPPKKRLKINPGGTVKRSKSKNISKPKTPTGQDNLRKRKTEEAERETDPVLCSKKKTPKTQERSRKRKKEEAMPETDPVLCSKRKTPKTQERSMKRKKEEAMPETDTVLCSKRKTPKTQERSRKRKKEEAVPETDTVLCSKRKTPKTRER